MMSMAPEPIPMLDLSSEIDMMWDDLMKAVQDVLRSGQFILGPQVEAFEEEIADYLGVKHAIGVNSGTDALVISLRALGVGPGDEVITTPFTFFATAESISNVGATPVFVDIDPLTFNIDPTLIESAITERTKAILPVHLYGQAADMDPIMEIARRHGLKVVEDVAQAMGGEYNERKNGSIGDAGAFSFFPTKNLGGFGYGGLIATNDEDVAKMSRKVRTHGTLRKYENEILGYNSRLDELQAAMLRVRLTHLDRLNDLRRVAATGYSVLLDEVADVETPFVGKSVKHVFHQYTVRISQNQRDHFRQTLAVAGVSTAIYYPTPMHRLPMYKRGHKLPRADRACQEALSLPLWPGIPDRILARISELVRCGLQ